MVASCPQSLSDEERGAGRDFSTRYLIMGPRFIVPSLRFTWLYFWRHKLSVILCFLCYIDIIRWCGNVSYTWAYHTEAITADILRLGKPRLQWRENLSKLDGSTGLTTLYLWWIAVWFIIFISVSCYLQSYFSTHNLEYVTFAVECFIVARITIMPWFLMIKVAILLKGAILYFWSQNGCCVVMYCSVRSTPLPH